MSLQPQTFEEAKSSFKPLRRSNMKRTSSIARKASPARRKAKRKLTDGQLKKKVWKEFSIFIRTRGANEFGRNRCVTCGMVWFWKKLHAGHFVRGRLNANLFDERGVHPQCYGCNVGRQGHLIVYYKFMLERYGQEVIDELLEQNNRTRKWQAGELAALLEKYQTLNSTNPLLAKESE